jgi:DNA helicase INO80
MNNNKMSQRKASRKGKETRPLSPSNDVVTSTKQSSKRRPEPLLDSSDLEDCPEVWTDELADYVLETQKRQNQVAQYFWTSILVSCCQPF